jgi:predicted ribosome quality control (RQC) complex YloA/Tae2 family protein
MSTVDEEETETASSTPTSSKTVDSTWDVPGLKKELLRLIQRCHKKVGQANLRLEKAKDNVERQSELQQVQTRLRKLNALEEALSTISNKKNTVLPKDIALLAIELDVSDVPPTRPPREKKEKGPRRDAPSRKPYRRYYSYNNIEIRVGKKAEDNDELTLSPEHRDGSDWWMHASGCPGSHVVIRYGQEHLPEDVVQDAAALAARQSKCTGSVIKVSLTRCRDIKKPPFAKAGLVLLTGKVRTVSVNMKEAEVRLERLEKTVLVN